MNNKKLRITEKLSYGLGDIPGAVSAIFGAFLMMFYTDNMGMSAGAIGTMFLVSRLLDGVSDLIAGSVIDKTRTKWGKARPWLLWLAIPTGLTVALIFMVPDANPTIKIIYAFITYNLFNTIMYTFVGVAKNSLMALMTQDINERGKLGKYAMLFGLGGSMFGCSITLPFVYKLGGDIRAWRIVFIVYGVITTLSLLGSFFMSKEYVKPIDEIAVELDRAKKITFKQGLNSFRHNKYFVLTTIISVVVGFGITINSSAQMYFYTYNMNNAMLMTSLSMVSLIPTILGIVFLIGPSLKYLGRKKTMYVGAMGQVIASIFRALAVPTLNMPLLVVGTVIGGLCVGLISVPVSMLAANAVDYGEYKTGKRIEGIGGSIVTFSQKISTGIATASIGWILALTGYIANSEVQTAATTFGISAAFAYIPAIMFIATIIIIKVFDNYEEDLEKIKKEKQTV